MRTKEDVLNKLYELSFTTNFFDSLLFLTHKNLSCTFEELATINLQTTLNEYELSFLYGLWLKNRNKNTPNILETKSQANLIHQLMDEYHLTFLQDYPKINLQGENYQTDFLKSPGAIQETIFYAGSGAYDFQFTNYYESKYKKDRNWIFEKKGFEISEVHILFAYIKYALNIKINKKRNKNNYLQIYDISVDNYIFKKNPNFLKILDSISISDNEMLNENFNQFGDLNQFRIRPILKKGKTYTIPISFLLGEALYDSPFYLMNDDKKYCSTALKNRGDSAEEIVRNILARNLDSSKIFVEVILKEKKSTTITDIDVCVIKDDKMIIFQVKSKRLTQLSKKGNINKFHNDYKLAIRDANTQALISQENILNGDCHLELKDSGEKITFGKIKEIYYACVVLDNYPALTSHTRLFFYNEETIPITISIFDLEIIIDYLDDFDSLFNYFKNRNLNSKYYFADNELAYLGKYLNSGLEKPEGVDRIAIDNQFAQFFDGDYYPRLLRENEKVFNLLIKNINRNDYCFCGSGLKYKKCCEIINF